MGKPLAWLIKKRMEKPQTNRNRNEKGDVTSNTTEMQRLIKDDHEQLYANQMDNPEEMDTFLEKCNLPRLNWK